MAVAIEEIIKKAEEMRISLTEWQVNLIQDRETRRWCLNCGRKVGKTTAIEFRTAMRLINDDIRGDGLVGGICIVSKGQAQAKLILSSIKTILTAFGYEFTIERGQRQEGKIFVTASEIQMPNGNRAFALPCGVSADNLRPYSFHEFVYDEADLLPEAVFVSTEACLARFDGIQILESTPNTLGDRNTYFARAFFGEMPGYKVLHITTSSAFHVPKEWLARQKTILTAQVYEREYEAKFASNATTVFPEPLIDSCVKAADNTAYNDPDAVFLGVNFARFGSDQSVIAENFFKNGVSRIRAKVVVGSESRIMHVEEELKRMIAENKKIDNVVVDDRALGMGPMQALVEEFGSMILGVANHEILKDIEGGRSRYIKEDLYVNLLRLMERGLVEFDDPEGLIKLSLMDIKYEYYKRSGMVKIWGLNAAIAEAVVRAVFPVWGRNAYYGEVKDAIRIF